MLLSFGAWLMLRKNTDIIREEKHSIVQWSRLFAVRTKKAIPALIMPVIILGGIYGGIMTPTESAGIAILYAIPVSMFIYRKLNVRELGKTFVETACTTGVIMVMIGLVMMLGRVLMMENVPTQIMSGLLRISDNPAVILVLINIFMVIIGMLMDDCSATLLCAPILMPLILKMGMSPYQFAAIMGVNIGMGNITPPSAPFLYLAARIFKVNASDIIKPTVFLILIAYIPTLLLVTYVPEISLWFPKLVLGDNFGV